MSLVWNVKFDFFFVLKNFVYLFVKENTCYVLKFMKSYFVN